MYHYTIYQWILFFFSYCFIGWIIEDTVVFIGTKKFVNRGFLRGPVLPIYGSGAIIMLLVALPFKDVNPFLVYLFGMIAATVLEYLTGTIMENTLKMKYWDYSDYKLQYKGRICAVASLFWGVLCLFLTYVIHPIVSELIIKISYDTTIVLSVALSVIFLTDTFYAFKTAISITKILSAITNIKNELENLSVQLNQKIEDKLDNSEHISELHDRIQKLKDDKNNIMAKLNYFKKDFIKANPTATSQKFNAALSELRDRIYQKYNNK